jgi:O-antigen/teichoic acid export membrane protein
MNLAASLAGGVWSTLLSLLLVPVYVRLMGLEAFGVVGFFLTLQSVFLLVDFGPALTRELARLDAAPGRRGEMRALVHKMERICWAIAVVLAAVIWIAAAPIAEGWLRSDRLDATIVTAAIRWMAIAIALQIVIAFYGSGLQGLQRLGRLNMIAATAGTVRGLGAVGVLMATNGGLEEFFAWTCAVSLVQTAVLRATLSGSMPDPGDAAGSTSSRLGSFASSFMLMSILGGLLAHVDKVVLSRVLELGPFAAYTIASGAASSISLVGALFFVALFPRFAELVARGHREELTLTYDRAVQVLGAIVFPAAAVLAFLNREVLVVWTGNESVASAAGTVLAFLSAGFALAAIYLIPHAVQLAHGVTSIALTMNLVAVAIVIPLNIVLGARLGAVGPAGVWLALNLSYNLYGVFATHSVDSVFRPRRYLRNALFPLLGSVAAVSAIQLALPSGLGRWALAGALGGTFFVAATVAFAVTPHAREAVLHAYQQLRVGQSG